MNQRLPFPAGLFSEALAAEMSSVATVRRFPRGAVVLEHGAVVRYVPIVLSGAVRISRRDTDGRNDGAEVLLYYLEAGDTCAATVTSGIGTQFSQVEAIAEVDSEIAFLPADRIEKWLATDPSWRRFLLRSYQERFEELLGAVDALAFHDLRARLVNNLHEKAKLHDGRAVEATHQQLADELNSSRVVVSRLLKALEREGIVRLARNKIELAGDSANRPSDR